MTSSAASAKDNDSAAKKDAPPILLKLREDLRCSLHQYGDETCYILEDPVTSRFFRFGPREWSFVSLLSGQATVLEALKVANEVRPDDPLSKQEAVQICRWLAQSKLVTQIRRDEAGAPRTVEVEPDEPKPTLSPLRKLNPFFIRIPLLNPDRWLRDVMPLFSWAFSAPAVLAWSVLCLFGAYCVLSDWGRFTGGALNLISNHGWISLVAIWLALKLVHETAHAVACKKFGGNVPRAGVILILFSPIAYVDVTSAWRIRSKWRRIAIALAGVYVEMAVAAVAAVVWAYTQNDIVADLAHRTVIVAGVATLLFNLNPLVRFDGYYVFADLLGVTNLYPRGQKFVQYLGRRWLLGLPAKRPKERGLVGAMVKAHGLAALVWRISFFVGVCAAASLLFHGLGLVLALFGAVLWGVLPLFRLIAMLAMDGKIPARLRLGAAMRLAVIGGCLYGVSLLPWPFAYRSPGVVEYAPLTIVRAPTDGFIRDLYVADRETVSADRPLARLTNEETTASLQELEIERRLSEIKSRTDYFDEDVASYQVERKYRESLDTKIDELQNEIDAMLIRSPENGTVLDRDVLSLLGQYVEEGAPLMSIADESRKEVLLSIDQADHAAFAKHLGSRVLVKILGGQGTVAEATLRECEPRATKHLAHEALGAHRGGPLAVRSEAVPGGSEDEQTQRHVLTTPRFTAYVSLPASEAIKLHAGRPAIVLLDVDRESIGEKLYDMGRKWLETKLGIR